MSVNSDNNRLSKDQSRKCKKVLDNTNTRPNSGYVYDLNFMHPNMSFTTQPSSFGPMSQPVAQQPQPPQPMFGQCSPTAQYNNNTFAYQPTPPPSPWANELLNDMKQIKAKMQSIDTIEKLVKTINAKVSDLETKTKDLDLRVTQTENSCQFQSNENEANKKDLKTVKEDIKDLKKNCDSMNKNSASLNNEASAMEQRLTDLEARSMRDNLMFYGIKEGGETENCSELVKDICLNVLHVDNANDMLFDRAHRVGQKSATARPIVVKFHYYTDREKVRQASFTYSDDLKTAQFGVGAQLPKGIRDARKPLYPVMKKAKDEGKNVKFVGKKLFINGSEHKPATPMAQ